MSAPTIERWLKSLEPRTGAYKRVWAGTPEARALLERSAIRDDAHSVTRLLAQDPRGVAALVRSAHARRGHRVDVG